MPSKNTKKKLKESAKSQQPARVEEKSVEAKEVATQTEVAPVVQEADAKVEEKAVEKTDKTSKTKKKEKKPSKLKQKTKEVFSELKKVTWPTAGQVAKKTAVVLAVVAIFAVVLLGIHKLLEVVYTIFINNLK